MQTLTVSETSKSTSAVSRKIQQQPFFAPARVVQPKLTIRAVDDQYEREADAMAERVMRMPANTSTQNTFFRPAGNSIQRQPSATAETTEPTREGTPGDVLKAVTAIPQVNFFLENLGQQFMLALGRTWDDSGHLGKIGLLTTGGSLLAGVGLSVFAARNNPEALDLMSSPLSGTVFRLPASLTDAPLALRALGLEANFDRPSPLSPFRNNMVGLHLDVGLLLQNWAPGLGFGRADSMSGMGAPPSSAFTISRKCEKCEEEKLLRKSNYSSTENGIDEPGFENYVSGLGSSGIPLSRETRSFFEPRMGYDFSNVKIHTDSVAAKSAGSINALAYTNGDNIVFNQNQYSPETERGKSLLAHELTHVVQQSNNTNGIQREVINMPEERITVGMPSDLSSLSTPAAAGSMSVGADPALIQLNSQLPETLLPFTTGGWDGNRIANILGQYDQIPGTDSDAVRCVQAVALMSHILMGPPAASDYLSAISLQGMLTGRFGTRERTAMRVIDFVRGRIQRRQATFDNLYWTMEAVHDLFYGDASGTPAVTPGAMREQITPPLDPSQRMVNINTWCNNGAELIAQAATLNPGEQFMLNTWSVSFNHYFDIAGVPTTQQRLTYNQTDDSDRPLGTVSIRRIDTSRKPAASQIDLNRDHKSGHQMLIYKDAADSHIKMYEPELTPGGTHLFDLTADPSVIASSLFDDQSAFEIYKYVQLLGKMVPATMP